MSKILLALGDRESAASTPTQKNDREQLNFPACTDHRGEAVRYVDINGVNVNPYVSKIAVRYLSQSPISEPAIVYDDDFLRSLSKVEFDFTLAHERYHLTSGDAYRAYKHYEEHNEFQSRRDLQAIEDDADAHAARQLKRQFNYSRADVESLRPLINRVTSCSQQDARMEHILACYDGTAPKP